MKWFLTNVFVGLLIASYAQPADTTEKRHYHLQSVDVIEVSPAVPDGDNALEVNAVEDIIQRLNRVELIHRGAYAPDIQVGGLRYEQINLTIDGMQIFGACTDRMDPVSSYVETHNLNAVELGVEGNSGLYGSNLGAAVNLSLKRPDFKRKGLSGVVSSSLATNNFETSNNIALNYAASKWAVRWSASYRRAGEMTAGGGERILYSQYNKANTALAFQYKLNDQWVLDFNGIYDHAWDVGYASLPMDVGSAVGKIGSLALRYYGKEKLERWETKFYMSDVAHIMDDSKRPDVPIRMDMPGWSKTGGFYSQLDLVHSRKWSSQLKIEGYRNWRRAEMTMYPPNEQEMFMLTWPDAFQDAVSVYASSKYSWSNSWTMGFSVRGQLQHAHLASSEALDYMSSLNSEFTERYYGVYSAGFYQNWRLKKRHNLRFSAHYDERAPGLSELFGFYLYNAQDGYDYIGNTGLDKERSSTLEMVYSGKVEKLNWRAGADLRRIENYIFGRTRSDVDAMTIGANGVREYVNTDLVHIANVFTDINWQSQKWSAFLRMNYRIGEMSSGDPLPLISPFSTQIQWSRKLDSWGELLLSMSAHSKQERINEAFGEDPTPGFALLNIGWLKTVQFEKRSLYLQLDVKNIMDHYYNLHNSWNNVPQIGRQLQLKLRLEI